MFEEQIKVPRRSRGMPDRMDVLGGSGRGSFPKKKILLWSGIALLVLIVIFVAYQMFAQHDLKNPDTQQQVAAQQASDIVGEVGKIMELPTDTPQIATVSDVDTLKKTQPFFDKAQNGDQVLIFTTEAILYRPSTHKIINVAPVNRDATKPAEPVSKPATVQPGATTKSTKK